MKPWVLCFDFHKEAGILRFPQTLAFFDPLQDRDNFSQRPVAEQAVPHLVPGPIEPNCRFDVPVFTAFLPATGCQVVAGKVMPHPHRLPFAKAWGS